MTPATILNEARAAGVTVWLDGGALRYRGPHEAVVKLLPALKAHKPALLQALSRPDPPVLPLHAADLKEFFEERSAILEHDAGLPRPEAELEAGRMTTTLARNRGYAWASLRAALAGYPALLALVPDRPGQVDALPFGVARLAVFKGRRVLRQGTFTGVYEVKA